MRQPRGLLVDLDGVVYDGDGAIEGSAEALAELRRRGMSLLFVTNTTSQPRSALVTKLAGFGIPAQADELWTPAAAASAWLPEHAPGPAALFTPAVLKEDLAGVPTVAPDAERGASSVVVGDLGRAWDYAKLNRAFRLLHYEPDAKLVALGMTRYWKAPDGISLDVAPFVKALEYATGREAIVLGKPARAFFHAAAAKLGLPPEDLLMIGDDVRGDVGGAQQAGLQAALVRTGKFRESDLDGDVRPEAVIDRLANAPALLFTNQA
ncbi:MAG: TIGR01458 family HAD-type hydrolase [Bryobacterales bacterium]